MARVLFVVALLSFVSVLFGASSKVAAYTESTAVVVRAHPWLTRGLARESLIGIRFWGGIDGNYGGPLVQPVTFRFQLKNCTREDLGELALWYLPYNQNPYSWREGLGQMAGTISETEVSETEFTLTYTPLPDNGETWIHPRTETRTESAYIWLTAAIDPAISRDAEIRVRVDNETIRLQDGSYAVDNNLLADGTVAPHRVYPYKYRVNAYLRADRMHGVAGRASDVLDDATEARLAGLTDVMLSSLKVAYDRESGSFYLNLGETYNGSGTYADGLRRMTDLRDGTNKSGTNPSLHAAPHLRVFASLDKGPFIQALNPDGTGKTEVVGYDDEGKPITKPVWEKLDSDGDGNAHEAYPLGHAAGALHRAALVDGIVEMMAACDLDGLDVDWEYPNQIRDGVSGGGNGNREFEKYGLLLRDLAEAFFNHGWELAMCTNLGYQMPHAEVMAVPDFINSMAYGGGTLNASNKVMDTAIAVLTSRNVPKRRILLGQAIFSNTSYHLGWDEIVSRLRNDQSKDYFSRLDSDTYWQAWSYNGRSGAYHTYTGPTTYRAKCNRARMEGYGGVMSWGYYADTRWGTDDLLCLGQNQAQAVWPHDYRWPTPPQDDGFYLLDSEDDWFWFQDNPGHNVRLAADIAFTHDPLPIERFARTLDGAGHTLTLPRDVWLCTFDDTALFRTLSGTVKDLTVVLEGRAVTRNDRKDDTAAGNTSLKLLGNGRAALLAASLTGNATLADVSLRLAEGAEVQGAKQAGLLAANAWTNQSPGITLTRVRADIAGIVRNLADNTGDCPLDGTDAEGNRFNTLTQHTCVGGLIGWVGAPSGAVALTDCAVAFAPTARVANDTGYDDAAGGAVGHVNTAAVLLDGLDVAWRAGAAIAAKAPADKASAGASPWAACFSDGIVPGVASGRILVPRAERAAFREAWPSYWLERVAPLWFPGYRLRLR